MKKDKNLQGEKSVIENVWENEKKKCFCNRLIKGKKGCTETIDKKFPRNVWLQYYSDVTLFNTQVV